VVEVNPVLVSRFQRNNVSVVCEKRAFNHMRQSGIQSNEVLLVVVGGLLILVVVDEADIDNQQFVLSVQFQLPESRGPNARIVGEGCAQRPWLR
jgi:hypothetical protein